MAMLFTKAQRQNRPASKLDSVTLRGFGGGWNTADDDLSMAPKYLPDVTNFYRTSSAAQALRFGTQFRVDIRDVRNSDIIDGFYFNGKNVVVTTSGHILTFDGDGTNLTEIWNSSKAAALPGAPLAWSSGLTQVSFVPYKTSLIVHNGIDKPVEVQSSFVVRYLQDGATGSNVNVPIGKYGCVAANYHCVAGIAASPTEVLISAQGTAGTFIGDPAPNDSISIDVGAYAPEGAASIRGIAGFRTFLIVFLQNIAIQIKLGGYDESDTHVPEFPDTFPQFGLLGHRCIATVENDLFFGGLAGLSSARRNIYSPETVDADYLSSLVAQSYRRIVGGLSDTQQLVNSFMVFDKLSHNLMLFSPSSDVLVYTYDERLKIKAWTKFANLSSFDCGWSSILGRVYFADGTKVFQLGNDTFTGENYHADRLLDRTATWSTETSFAQNSKVYDSVGNKVYTAKSQILTGTVSFEQDRKNNPDAWSLYEGDPISFVMELPWIDGQDPMKVKHNRFVSLATRGSGSFTLEAYVDNLYKDEDGTVIHNAALTTAFVGNEAIGYGGGSTFGGGRRSRDPNLWGYPVKFKTIKFRLTGSTRRKLEIVNFSFLFARGRFKR